MANPEHVRIVKKGSDAINKWREEHPNEILDLFLANLSGANLIGANLSLANLIGANLSLAYLIGANLSLAYLSLANLSLAYLSGADLSLANLSGTNLIGAKLSLADLTGAILYGTNLTGADLTGAKLSLANLTEADLTGAKLSLADLTGAILSGTNLTGADLKDSVLRFTIFDYCDLTNCKGLSNIKHQGPSSIGVNTLIITYRKANGLSEELKQFFINAGVPKELLDTLPSIIREIKYKSCFISYGEPDKDFAIKLYNELRRRSVPCWIYSMDYTPGERTWKEIVEKIREYDKVIILCSIKSLIRDGVKKEIERLIDEDPDKMIPISLDDDWKHEGFKVERGGKDLKQFLLDRNYVNFTDGKIDDAKIERLLRALEFRHN